MHLQLETERESGNPSPALGTDVVHPGPTDCRARWGARRQPEGPYPRHGSDHADGCSILTVAAGYGRTMTNEPSDRDGSLRTALANAMVAIMKRSYGKGPTGAKAWLLDDYVFIAMEGGLTRNEETLIADGKEEVVRGYRLAFQETIREETMDAVAELTGRKVLTYHSQIVFDPPRAFEIFVLEPG
jgi:uncharacterized protein YbcI